MRRYLIILCNMIRTVLYSMYCSFCILILRREFFFLFFSSFYPSFYPSYFFLHFIFYFFCLTNSISYCISSFNNCKLDLFRWC